MTGSCLSRWVTLSFWRIFRHMSLLCLGLVLNVTEEILGISHYSLHLGLNLNPVWQECGVEMNWNTLDVHNFHGCIWWNPISFTSFCISLSPPVSTLWLPAVFVSVLCVLKSLLSWETQLKSLSAGDRTSARTSGTITHLFIPRCCS